MFVTSRPQAQQCRAGVDCVFHLAAQIDVRQAVEDAVLDAQVNVGGTINVLNACVEAHVRRFTMSSTGGALYGEPSMLPATEQATIRPLSPYGVSKSCAEQYLSLIHISEPTRLGMISYAV